MDASRKRLLQCLEPGRFRTGTEMGGIVGLSRAAVHKHIQALAEHGLPVHSVPGRGYRLEAGAGVLNASRIREQLSASTGALLASLEILDEVDSTSAYLARRFDAAPLAGRVCLAERQTRGRGRRGRSWTACPYRDLILSIGVEYPGWPPDLPALGLATALMVIRALESQGARELRVKWPNDIVHGDAKLCGILLDVTGEAHGGCRLIVGIGINLSTDGTRREALEQAWTDVASIAGAAPDRNRVAAACLDELLPGFRSFPTRGFAACRDEWEARDALAGREIRVHFAGGGGVTGRAAGVDDAGRLRVRGADGRCRCFHQGDVSIRAT